VADEEEDVEGLEGQGLDDKEVGRPDHLSVVGRGDSDRGYDLRIGSAIWTVWSLLNER
jgi:hypothetical protein